MANSKISALTSATTPLAGTETLPVVQSSTTKKVSIANVTAGRTVQMSSLDANGGSSTGGAIISGSIPSVRASSTVLDVGDGNRYLALGANASTPGLVKLISASSDASIYQYLLTSDTSYNLTFNTGNLIQGTAAKGINFTANSAAAGKTSQLLNWYEEGTWTPSLGGNATYFFQEGTYTRVGRQVTAVGFLYINVMGTGNTTTISGLPFVAQNTYQRGCVSFGELANIASNVTSLQGNVVNGTSTIQIWKFGAAATGNTSAAIFGNQTVMYFTATYFV